MNASENLRVSHLSHHYPSAPGAALCDVSFEVCQGRTLAVVGPSGAGKSTLLRTVAGLTRPDAGQIFLGSRRIEDLRPQERRIALVFQTDALFSHMSVRANLNFALRDRKQGRRVEELARLLDIAQHLDRMPATLSGGERQRVSIVRSLLSDPAVLLLDEPLAHLDPELRALVRNELIGVREQFRGPIVYVTHDHSEALAIADELLVLIAGVVEDTGAPQRVYDAPRTVRTAAFLGERPMNLLKGLTSGAITGIRPEHVRIDASGKIVGSVVRREPTGADAYLYVRTEAGTIAVRTRAEDEFRAGEVVGLTFDERHVRRFDPTSGVSIG
ncbi:MAG: ABC transporter ATP-binding protein [Candidatus Baltobacteraceae bacterium]